MKVYHELEALKSQLSVNPSTNLGECRCKILRRYSLPCKHYPQRIYNTGEPIPRSLIHPRWWLAGPPITYSNWFPTHASEEDTGGGKKYYTRRY